ncbi:putative Pre-mRNA-splicing factor ISY1 like protein [Monoraphidium neglectum]|uniref:Putative Pre-mRNA-splicing factor ISY1 like protein n=1 Tax=Monoraphidium neglectum TaxID=145388 RepID=A0A0D2K2K3_9CHLO|nr:putative Pre-mRNA-splicing factor ISY1 like protein [Monoraphidium neglectum]KIZ04778.1 putative Pre-mRNA-splicing factor ISY1 like protein [Monoraphidium neglectum]|eukprot:XP_013903797.1 putative Pre-mRNA-splicing factor ISY1 like protein [Monoraphidium neglectum]
MARNQEKAQSMLNRFLAGKEAEKRGPKQRRPYLASEVTDLNEADKWRQQILREIGKKVMEIQNTGLGEHRIRDLNDEINKLIREKGHWEKRIVQLGGPDYAKTAPKITDSEGNAVEGASGGRGGGYRYFGAAKALPGVKELFEKEAPKIVRKTRFQMHKSITPDYYGFRDEEDGVLVKVEAVAERAIQAQKLREWEAREAERDAALAGTAAGGSGVGVGAGAKQQRKGQLAGGGGGGGGLGGGGGAEEDGGTQFVAYVPLPDQAAIEQRILEKKKQDLLAKYTSDSLLHQQEEARALLNKR